MAVAVATLYPLHCSAASFWGNKASDASVCDLSPSTSERVDQKVLIPAGTDVRLAAEAYFRVTADFIVQNCSDRQMLILQGSSQLPFDSLYLVDLANTACLAATVTRSSVVMPGFSGGAPGFELRCIISKHSFLKTHLADREKAEPFSALLSRIQRKNNGGALREGAAGDGGGKRATRDCHRLVFGTLLFGGANDGCKE
jgi:hypothetical protein